MCELKNHLKLNIFEGDNVLVHSSLRSLGLGSNSADAIIDMLLELVGPTGTIIMSTGTVSFSKTKIFDYYKTPSEMGALTEVFRKRYPNSRSRMPMTSFVAFGQDSSLYLDVFENYQATNSPFQRLVNHPHGKVLLLGVDFNRCTLYHLAEEVLALDYNFYKNFDGVIIDEHGAKPIDQTYFVRKSLDTIKDAHSAASDFISSISCSTINFGDSTSYCFSASDFHFYMLELLRKKPMALLV